MATSLQHLGTLSMLIGSVLYLVSAFETTIASQIAFFQPAISVSLLLPGSILSWGFKKIDGRFLRVLGANMFLIGAAYQISSLRSKTSYASCVLGGVLILRGSVIMFKGIKPAKFVILMFIFIGFSFLVNGCNKLMFSNSQEIPPRESFIRLISESNAWIDLIVGFFDVLEGILLLGIRHSENLIEANAASNKS